MTVAGLWAVINNAGFNRQAPVELTSMDTFHHVADVMLFGTVLVTKAFLPLIRRAKGVRKKVDGAGWSKHASGGCREHNSEKPVTCHYL